MAKYAYIKNAEGANPDEFIKAVDYDNFDAAAVAHKFGLAHAVRIIPIVRLTDPTISDTSAETYGGMNRVIESTRVTRQRSIVAIPQDERDERTELLAIKAVALDLKNGVGTAGQRLARCERVLFRILKDQYGS